MKLLLLAVLLVTSPGQSAGADSVQVAPVDFHTPASPGLRYSVGDDLLRERVPNAGFLTVSLDPRNLQSPTSTNRFNAMLNGAGTATSLGMFLGAVGTSLGWFGENTSWGITGAMAAAGALYAGSHYTVDPGLKFDWYGDSVIPGYAPSGSR